MSKRRIVLVTGANGFIGTHIVEALLKRSWAQCLEEKVRPRTARLRFSNFDSLDSSSEPDEPLEVVGCDLAESVGRSNAARFAGASRYRFVTLEGLQKELDAGAWEPSAVIHNGACSSTVETDPEVFAKLNLGASQALWRVCAQLDIPFIYASSAAVYGDGLLGFSDASPDTAQFKPLNLYGKSKHDFDLWALEQKHAPSHWFGLRYFNVYGPFESHKGGQASMVYHGYQQITRTGKIRLFESNRSFCGHGEQKRDFIFVDDITRYTLLLLAKSLRALHRQTPFPMADGNPLPKGQGLFVNLGTGSARTWNELAHHLFSALGLKPQIEYFPIPENLAKQYQDFTQAELGSLKEMGIDPVFYDLGQGVRNYVHRYLMRGL
jgi:ADP-L-glycero-D-manno-heptose 6-epimerase